MCGGGSAPASSAPITPIGIGFSAGAGMSARPRGAPPTRGRARVTKRKQKSANTHALQDLLLLDVTPLTLSVADVDGRAWPLIKRNSTIPTRKMVEAVTGE